MSQNYKFSPMKFRRINLTWYTGASIGLGISLYKWAISIELPFIIFDLSYLSKKELDKMQKIANYFAENADLLDE